MISIIIENEVLLQLKTYNISMNRLNSLGLYLSNTSNKNLILEQIMANRFLRNVIDLSEMKGVLHSTITINRLDRKSVV